MNSLKVKKGDQVIVIASGDKGKKGKVITTDSEKHRVLVEGINLQKHHNKPRSAKETGGIVSKEGFIDVSNVMVVCPKCGRAVRVKYKFDDKGKKVRICGDTACGAVLDKAVKKAAKKADKPAAEAAEAVEKKPVKRAAKKAEGAEKKPVKKAPAKKAEEPADDRAE